MALIKLFGKYYVADRGDEKTFDETYSPLAATNFSSVAEANEWLMSNTDIDDVATIIEDVDAELEKFNAWVSHGMVRRKLTKKDKTGTHDYDPNVHTPTDVFNFYASNREDVPSASRRTWPSIQEVFTHLHSVYSADESDVRATLAVQQDSNFEAFRKEIEFVLSYHQGDDRSVRFPVFDHYLSFGGNTVALLSDDPSTDEWEIDGYEFHSGTLESCFEYLREHRYYAKA